MGRVFKSRFDNINVSACARRRVHVIQRQHMWWTPALELNVMKMSFKHGRGSGTKFTVLSLPPFLSLSLPFSLSLVLAWKACGGKDSLTTLNKSVNVDGLLTSTRVFVYLIHWFVCDFFNKNLFFWKRNTVNIYIFLSMIIIIITVTVITSSGKLVILNYLFAVSKTFTHHLDSLISLRLFQCHFCLDIILVF